MQRDGKRLHQGRVLEGQAFREAVEDAFRHGDEFRKCAVLPVILAGDAQHSPVIAEVDLATPAVITDAAVDGGVERDPVARVPVLHRGADLVDDPGRLVPHDDGRPTSPGAAIHPMHVAAADANGFDRDEHFIGSRCGVRHLL